MAFGLRVFLSTPAQQLSQGHTHTHTESVLPPSWWLVSEITPCNSLLGGSEGTGTDLCSL